MPSPRLKVLTLVLLCLRSPAEWAKTQVLRKSAKGEEIKSGTRKTLHRTKSKIEEAILTGELEVMKKPEWVEKNPLRRASLVQSKDGSTRSVSLGPTE
jgi:hypothetical protein